MEEWEPVLLYGTVVCHAVRVQTFSVVDARKQQIQHTLVTPNALLILDIYSRSDHRT